MSKSDILISKNSGSCEFCKCDKDNLYICPKCKKYYCSLKCYKSIKHSKCSEKFYQEQVENEIKITEKNNEEPKEDPKIYETLKNAESFEDYMEKVKKIIENQPKNEDDINPQIEADEDEEILFDSDEEPEYLSKIVDKSLNDYNDGDLEDINVKLTKAGIGSMLDDDDQQMDKLYNLLTDEEKKTFTKLAEAMHNEESGVTKSCFRKKKT